MFLQGIVNHQMPKIYYFPTFRSGTRFVVRKPQQEQQQVAQRCPTTDRPFCQTFLLACFKFKVSCSRVVLHFYKINSVYV